MATMVFGIIHINLISLVRYLWYKAKFIPLINYSSSINRVCIKGITAFNYGVKFHPSNYGFLLSSMLTTDSGVILQ